MNFSEAPRELHMLVGSDDDIVNEMFYAEGNGSTRDEDGRFYLKWDLSAFNATNEDVLMQTRKFFSSTVEWKWTFEDQWYRDLEPDRLMFVLEIVAIQYRALPSGDMIRYHLDDMERLANKIG